MADDLLPCPFCGGVAILHENDWCEPHEWIVLCPACISSRPSRSTKANAIAWWNRRFARDICNEERARK